jgi:ATP-binding cassette subfamily B protein
MIPRALISARRVAEVLNRHIEIQDKKDVVDLLDGFLGEITFHNVSFQYHDAPQPILKNVSFTAKANQTTAFIGSTGSGKSTLIHLIPRFYDVTEGSITIDGIDIRDMKQHNLHQLIGYVPQQGILFSGSIKDNILFGQDKDDEGSMEKAARIAQAKPFIESFEGQYDYKIAQGGKNVSGGQRQRLSIARAIAKQPRIYIFDDSFSALDYQTDQALRQALSHEIKSTKLIVAQRINSIKDADQIVVLELGKIVGIGTHESLLKNNQVYQEIASSQLSKEELSR